jgi:hypothetical protein
MSATAHASRPSSRTLPAPPPELAVGCLLALIALNLVQIGAGLAQVAPHPDGDVLPIIAATAALGLLALPMVIARRRLGYAVGLIFCLVSMIGMGPHKLLLAEGALVAPVALTGFVVELAFAWAALLALRG